MNQRVFVDRKENDELRADIAANSDQVNKLNADLKNEKEAANRGPTAAAKEHMARLKHVVQEKDEELQVCNLIYQELSV